MVAKQKEKALLLARKALQEQQKAGKDKREHNLIRKYEADSKSRTKAVHAMCFSCQGGDRDNMPDHGYKQEIRDCKIDCPLKAFRPYK